MSRKSFAAFTYDHGVFNVAKRKASPDADSAANAASQPGESDDDLKNLSFADMAKESTENEPDNTPAPTKSRTRAAKPPGKPPVKTQQASDDDEDDDEDIEDVDDEDDDEDDTEGDSDLEDEDEDEDDAAIGRRERELAVREHAIRSQWNDFQEFLKAKSGADKKAAAEKPEEIPSSLKVPEFDEEWVKRCKWDAAAGRFVPASKYDSPEIAEKLTAYFRWRDNRINDLARTDLEAMTKRELSALKEQIRKEIMATLDQRDTQFNLSRHFETNRSKYFVLDDAGKIRSNKLGEKLLTPFGKAYVEAEDAIRDSMGIAQDEEISNPVTRRRVHEQAEKLAGRLVKSQNETPTKTPPEKKREFLRRAKKGGPPIGKRNAALRRGGRKSPSTETESWHEMIEKAKLEVTNV